MSMNHIASAAVVSFALGLANLASAAAITLDFEGIGSQASINDFYNGGTDSQGHSGTNYGVHFSSNALALQESDPVANFSHEPTPQTVMYFLTGTAILNYAPGFLGGFSFFYSTVNATGDVNLWDGLNATGNLIGTIHLNALGAGPDPSNVFSNWALASLSSLIPVKSIDFGGTVNQVIYDNITLGGLDAGGGGGPVPEPASIALVGAALLALAAVRRSA